jgi:hypothetical protein
VIVQNALHSLSLCYAYNNEHHCVISGSCRGLSEISAVRGVGCLLVTDVSVQNIGPILRLIHTYHAVPLRV